MGDKYPVNRGTENNLNIKHNIQKRLTELQEHVCDKHGKVLSVRFDVHYPQDYESSGDNAHISQMIAKLVQHYDRQGLDPHYAWAREQESSSNPHYHCVIFLNGNKVRSFNHVFSNAKKYWSSTIQADVGGRVHHCTRGKNGVEHENGILISRSRYDYQDKFNEVHHQVSYLAKSAGKGELKDGIRDFGMSRIPKLKK